MSGILIGQDFLSPDCWIVLWLSQSTAAISLITPSRIPINAILDRLFTEFKTAFLALHENNCTRSRTPARSNQNILMTQNLFVYSSLLKPFCPTFFHLVQRPASQVIPGGLIKNDQPPETFTVCPSKNERTNEQLSTAFTPEEVRRPRCTSTSLFRYY